MSKIEVLRVPYSDGALVIKIDGKVDGLVRPNCKPALLSALLEDAGVVKMLLTCSLTYLEISGDAELPIGEYPVYVLPIPKDTKE